MRSFTSIRDYEEAAAEEDTRACIVMYDMSHVSMYDMSHVSHESVYCQDACVSCVTFRVLNPARERGPLF